MFDFSNQVVMITGAAGNLGQAVARAFWDAGAHLVLVDRTAERLSLIYPGWGAHPRIYQAAPYDIMDMESVQSLVHRVANHYGRLDILVNTVGGYRAGLPVHLTSLDVYDQMMALNARSAFILSSAVAPVMIAQAAGKIIHVAGKAGLAGSANAAAYSAAKSALIRLTESLSAELKENGIHVNCVLPGTINTPKNREAMPNTDPSRWVEASAVADVILFLASPAARGIHGAAIPVFGKG